MLNEQETNIVVSILANANIAVKDAPTVIAIINKLSPQPTPVETEKKK